MPKKASSSADILGRPNKKEVSNNVTSKCVICFKPITQARIDALISMKTPATKFTHVGCSTTTKIKGIYMGEPGTSEIKLCDKIYDDSVRSVFRKADAEQEGASDSDE